MPPRKLIFVGGQLPKNDRERPDILDPHKVVSLQFACDSVLFNVMRPLELRTGRRAQLAYGDVIAKKQFSLYWSFLWTFTDIRWLTPHPPQRTKGQYRRALLLSYKHRWRKKWVAEHLKCHGFKRTITTSHGYHGVWNYRQVYLLSGYFGCTKRSNVLPFLCEPHNRDLFY